MKSIVNVMEEPMSYYSYKRRKNEVREAIDYNAEAQKLKAWAKKENAKRFRPGEIPRSGSCMRAISRLSTFDTLPELRGKCGGTLRGAKPKLPGLEGTVRRAKARLKIGKEASQL